ncbi:hypothetical protein PMZ80_009517 [Knufia obscura]|uniref:Uncharacterized protein n=1 Tax=Knufia obscura TaxID=1635080 RepID=A0ABR0RD40_9EURO|nr:hypothetical protein PMZ80_009517 [Knufia obscura]
MVKRELRNGRSYDTDAQPARKKRKTTSQQHTTRSGRIYNTSSVSREKQKQTKSTSKKADDRSRNNASSADSPDHDTDPDQASAGAQTSASEPRNLSRLSDEVTLAILGQLMLPHYSTKRVTQFPRPIGSNRAITSVNKRLRGIALDEEMKNVLYVVFRLHMCDCIPFEGGSEDFAQNGWDQLKDYLELFSERSPDFIEEYNSIREDEASNPDELQTLSSVVIDLKEFDGDCQCDAIEVQEACYRANKLQDFLLCYLIEQITPLFQQIDITCIIYSRKCMDICDNLLEDMSHSIRRTNHTTVTQAGGLRDSRHNAQTLVQTLTADWDVTSLTACLLWSLNYYGSLLDEGMPSYYLATNEIIALDTYTRPALRLIGLSRRLGQLDEAGRRLFANIGNLHVLCMQTFAHYRLRLSNSPEAQNHWSRNDDSEVPVHTQGRHRIWEGVAEVFKKRRQFAEENGHFVSAVDFWCSVKQAQAGWELTQVRNVLAFPSEDELYEDEGYDSRLQAVAELMIHAQERFFWVEEQLKKRTLQDRAAVKKWRRRWLRWFQPVNKAVEKLDSFEHQRYEKAQYEEAAKRASHKTGGMSTRPIGSKIEKPKKKWKKHEIYKLPVATPAANAPHGGDNDESGGNTTTAQETHEDAANDGGDQQQEEGPAVSEKEPSEGEISEDSASTEDIMALVSRRRSSSEYETTSDEDDDASDKDTTGAEGSSDETEDSEEEDDWDGKSPEQDDVVSESADDTGDDPDGSRELDEQDEEEGEEEGENEEVEEDEGDEEDEDNEHDEDDKDGEEDKEDEGDEDDENGEEGDDGEDHEEGEDKEDDGSEDGA